MTAATGPAGGVTLADPESGVSDGLRAAAAVAATRLQVLRVGTEHGPTYVTGERTEVPTLWVTPVWDEFGRLDGGWRLTHGPTGLALPGTEGLDVRELRDLARLLGDLEVWSCDRAEVFARQREYLLARIEQAREQVTR